ncbi:MAG: phenylalanine--tRNA ligase subunit beta [Planctomycetaceae bacterium]|nr:phenylalanine--tRNA ligase subunit beta [Planctomycetaceae bacterium]
MLVSWNWLKQYVPLDMPVEELTRRVMMSGLNHESTSEVGGDLVIDLEVTSNRPDCLGHLGIAREVAVLFGKSLTLPAAAPKENASAPVDKLVRVRIECPDLCLRYTARVVRGVKIGPSPSWMVRRLAAVGIASINNVVDISNYVMMECGQPLHTFDFGKLQGHEIVIRRPASGETIEAIDHKNYPLGPDLCMICDARNPVAIGGVMGGATTEISDQTCDVLVEAAEFDPVSIRSTARQLNLHSDSSYRFERRVDPEGLDWASRRCCQLILELAGGELAAGMVGVGRRPPQRKPIVLRRSQIQRILGIDVPADRVREILVSLGNEPQSTSVADSLTFVPPSWRRDLSREIDLIEEVARIHGYDAIPEDVGVPMVPSARRREDRVLERIRRVLTSLGYDEAMTLSVVDQRTSQSMSPWTDAEPLCSRMPVLRGADRLRRSLTPSLLAARRTNESLANAEIELFEIARAYLPRPDDLPLEDLMLAITSGRHFDEVKGAIEAIFEELKIVDRPTADDSDLAVLDPGAACRLQFRGEPFGYVGQLRPEALKQFDLRGATTVAEIRVAPLIETADLVPRCAPQSPYPAVTRDLNLVVDQSIRWADVAATVRQSAGPCFESLEYRDTYRDAQRLGADRKSLLLTVALRSSEGTLTSAEADAVRDRIVAACRAQHGAELRA